MIKHLFIKILSIASVILSASCSKDGTATQATPTGTWVGTGQYGTTPGNPTYVFMITFKANGTVDIVGDNSTAIDHATGSWVMVQDSVRATYRYVSASAHYTLSGRIAVASNIMAGTIGLGTTTTGVGLFSVTKQ